LLAKAIRLKEDLCYVAVPEFISSPIGVGIQKNVKRPILATEANIQMAPRPKHANPGASPRIFVPTLPVAAKRNRFGPWPFFFSRKAVRIGRLAKANGYDFRV
ncbi:MAG TPA: hypothetical protein VF783_05930, partial [Terriglobales bacterium]